VAAEVDRGYFEEGDPRDRQLWLPDQSGVLGSDDANTPTLWVADESGRARTVGGLDPQAVVDEYDQHVLRVARRNPPGPDYRDTYFATKVLPPEGEQVELDKMPYVMLRMAKNVHQVDLAQLRFGLAAYLKVTDKCIDRLDDFDHPDKIAVTMPIFLDELIKASHRHVQGVPDAVGGWYRPFYSADAQAASPAGAMIDFLGSHIRYDLGVALFRTYTRFAHKSDYTETVNLLLNEVAYEIIDSYAEFYSLFGPARERFLKMALHEIYSARDDAWNAFVDLCHVSDFESYAKRREVMRHQAEQHQISGRKLASLALRTVARIPQGWEADDGTPVVHPMLVA
jgi:hypothetical protein